CLVDAARKGTLAGACARTRGIEAYNGAVGGPNEAVIHIARVKIISRRCPRRVEAIHAIYKGPLARTCARTRGIERRKGADGSAQEPVCHVVGVKVNTRDHPCRVDVLGQRALEETSARPWGVQRCDSTVRSAQETVKRSARISVKSRD